MKVCINCYTENPPDAVLCTDCGMSLRRAATGEEAVKLKELGMRLEAERREETRRRLERPLTASDIVYLFGEKFAIPWAERALRDDLLGTLDLLGGTPRPRGNLPVRVPYSGQKVWQRDLAHKLFEAAFVSLAEEEYVSLQVEKRKTLPLTTEAVAIGQEKAGDDLPPSLERAIMDALSSAAKKYWVKHVVRRVIRTRDGWNRVVNIVTEALMEMRWLHRGVVDMQHIHGKPTEEATALLPGSSGEAEMLKARLETFASVNSHLHKKLTEDVQAGITQLFVSYR